MKFILKRMNFINRNTLIEILFYKFLINFSNEKIEINICHYKLGIFSEIIARFASNF